jgi:uncharacterized damage-inducible protein DinB
MPIVDMLIAEMESESAATRRLLDRVPNDKLDWKPAPKSMSLGLLAAHVATIPVSVAEMSVADEREMGSFAPPTASSKDDLLAKHDASLQRAKEVLRGFDDAKLQAPWKMVSGGKTVFELHRGALLRSIMFNHLYHHRGQLTVYLRLLGVPLPSTYGPTADEHPFR